MIYWNQTVLAEQPEIDRGSRIGRVRHVLSQPDHHVYAINNILDFEYIVSLGSDSFFLHQFPTKPYVFLGTRLGTTIADELGAILFDEGIDSLLSITTQLEQTEADERWGGYAIVQSTHETRHIDFSGACGN